jgi:phosphatidylinositol dimannoside acyltransferase
MKEKLSYIAYLVGWKLIGILPEKVAYKAFNILAHRMYKGNSKSVKRLRTNLSIVKPHITTLDLELLVIQGLESYMRYWCDTFRIHRWSSERIERTVTTTNDYLLREPMAQGRGVVIALPHSGNWDHAGAYFCQQGIPLVTVAEVLKPEKLFEKFLQYRTSMGFEVLALDSRAFPTLMRRAREKRLIALVADRDLSDSGIPVTFFGRVTRMPAGPALIALKTGLPLVVAHISYNLLGIHINFTEVKPWTSGSEDENISKTVSAIAAVFEEGISAHPADWHMLQKIWVEEGLYQ